MKELVLSVPNISCHHCAHTIKMELGDTNGVKTIEVDIDSKLVTVQYEAPASEEAIRKLLTDINYPAEV